MAVTFVLGRAGAGKTRFCLDALTAELTDESGGPPLLLLVPEQATLQMERALARRSPRGGFSRAEVLSFTRLAERVFERAGRPPGLLGPRARLLGLRCLAAHRPRLVRGFGAAARTPGFFGALDRLINELIGGCVEPGMLRQAAEGLTHAASRRRTLAVAQLYRAYLDWLGDERTDQAQRLAALRERLERAEWLHEARIWVDGFAGFDEQELETLVALGRIAQALTITMLVDPGHALEAPRAHRPAEHALRFFRRTEATLDRLLARFRDVGVKTAEPVRLRPDPPPRFSRAPSLARLEAALPATHASGAPMPPAGNRESQVAVVACQTHRDELRRAAQFIREKVIESHGRLRFRDFAVIARDLEPFAPLVDEVFTEYELPYFLDRRRPLRAHALVGFVENLFDAVERDFAAAPMGRLLRSGLLPLNRAQAERLENWIVDHEVRGRAAWRREEWPFVDTRRSTYGRVRRALVDALDPLTDPGGPNVTASGAAWARALYETLAGLGVDRRIRKWIGQAQRDGRPESAETHRLAWDTLCEVLDDVHNVLGGTDLTRGEFASVLQSALAEATLALAPATLDQALVGSIERSRHPDIRYAWVFAFNEGVFPARPGEDEILGTAEREALAAAGLPAPRARRTEVFDERLLAYIAFTRPADGLVISYATTDLQGDEQFPSPLLVDVHRALPDAREHSVDTKHRPTCLREFARRYLESRDAPQETPIASPRLEPLRTRLGRNERMRGELDHLLRGLHYRNETSNVPLRAEEAGAESGPAWRGSPSRIETYLQCPFRYFARHALCLREPRGPAPAAKALGTAAHEILADVWRRIIRSKRPVAEIPDADWLAALHAGIAAFSESSEPDFAERRPQFAFFSNMLARQLRDVVLVHALRYRVGRFESYRCEWAFGRRVGAEDFEPLPALRVELPDGAYAEIHGYIDRVDRCAAQGCTALAVYDYKSSVTAIKNRFYLTGDALQIVTYALALQARAADPDRPEIAAVLLAPLYAQFDALDSAYVRDADDTQQRMYLLRPRSLLDARFLECFDPNVGMCQSTVITVRRTGDGRIDARHSDVTEPGTLDAWLRLAGRTIAVAVEGILDGNVRVSPLVENRRLSCNTCDFLPVCRFERGLDPARPAGTALPVLDEVPSRRSDQSRDREGAVRGRHAQAEGAGMRAPKRRGAAQ
jgi:ATP-dependent helicase/nuclease subunit B